MPVLHRLLRPHDPLCSVTLIAAVLLFLLSAHRPTSIPHPPVPPPVRGYLPPDTHIPPLWRALGATSFQALPHLIRSTPRRDALAALADHYLAPWSSATSDIVTRAPVSASLLDSMEGPLRHSTARIRLSGDGRVLYRVLHHWEKTYRLPRLIFFLDLLARMLRRHPELRTLHVEFYLNTADGPRATVDSMSQEFGALPIFSFRSERHFIDIPVPDPVEHGSKVTGAGYTLPSDFHAPPWTSRVPRLVFRGVASCIQHMRFGNWHLNPRVRAASISAAYPELLDLAVTKWIKLTHGSTPTDVEHSANITQAEPLSLAQQLSYRYIIDIDGGLGSSRKRWMLRSGSTSFFQQSAVFQWYEPLLVPWLHFVPVDRWFRDVVELVRWARGHDWIAREIAHEANEFAKRFLVDGAALDFLSVLLQKYADLQPDARYGNASVPNLCDEFPDVENGPMGCGMGWFEHILGAPAAFGCRHKPQVEGSFVCHRPHPSSGRKQVKRGVDTPYPVIAESEINRPPRAGDNVQDRLIM